MPKIEELFRKDSFAKILAVATRFTYVNIFNSLSVIKDFVLLF